MLSLLSDTPKSTHPVLKVAVNVPLSREFDYLPAADVPVPAPGTRVLVQFGSRQQVGPVRLAGHPAGQARFLPTPKLHQSHDIFLVDIT